MSDLAPDLVTNAVDPSISFVITTSNLTLDPVTYDHAHDNEYYNDGYDDEYNDGWDCSGDIDYGYDDYD